MAGFFLPKTFTWVQISCEWIYRADYGSGGKPVDNYNLKD